jgi:hypothetical protein
LEVPFDAVELLYYVLQKALQKAAVLIDKVLEVLVQETKLPGFVAADRNAGRLSDDAGATFACSMARRLNLYVKCSNMSTLGSLLTSSWL